MFLSVNQCPSATGFKAVRKYLKQLPHGLKKVERLETPWQVVAVHLILLVGVVLASRAVTGGGLTVIANAPNPAGFAVLKGTFEDGTISLLWLAVAATPPTLVAVAAFQLLHK
jgi:hypothetical protein